MVLKNVFRIIDIYSIFLSSTKSEVAKKMTLITSAIENMGKILANPREALIFFTKMFPSGHCLPQFPDKCTCLRNILCT